MSNNNIRNQALKVLNRESHFHHSMSPDQGPTTRSCQFILNATELFTESFALGYDQSVLVEYFGMDLGTAGNYSVLQDQQRNNSILYYPNPYMVISMDAYSEILLQKMVAGANIKEWNFKKLIRVGNNIENKLSIEMTYTFTGVRVITYEPNHSTGLVMVSFSYTMVKIETNKINLEGQTNGKTSVVEYSTYTTVETANAKSTS